MPNDPVPFIYPPGVVRGVTPYEGPGRWYDTNLIRWRDGRLLPIGGWTSITGVGALNSNCRALKAWRTNDNRLLLAAGCENAIYVRADHFINCSPSGLVNFRSPYAVGYGVGFYGKEDYGDARSTPSTMIVSRADQWSLDTWGEDLLALSSADGRLLHYTGADVIPSNFTVVGAAPISNRGMLVTPQRQVVLFGCGGIPRRVGWCSRENYNDWDFASVTNTAGFIDLDASSPLVAWAKVPEGFLVFSDREVYLFRYIGLPYVYSQERLGDTGILNQRCIAVHGGQAFWLSRNGFWIYQSGQISQLHCDVGGLMFSTMQDGQPGHMDLRGSTAYAHACAIQHQPEIWWWYTDTNAGGANPNRYVIYNATEQWWAIGKLNRVAAAPADVSLYWYTADINEQIYQQEDGWLGNDALPILSDRYAETNFFPAGQGVTTLTQALFSGASGPTAIGVRFYGRNAPYEADRMFGPYTPRANGYVDIRVTARDLRTRIYGTVDTDWSIGVGKLLNPQTFGFR